MRAHLKRTLKNERGQSLVELSVIAVLMLTLFAAIADFGRIMHDYIIITNAAREGARYGSRYPWNSNGIRAAAIQEAASSGIQLYNGDITITPEAPPNAQPGQPGVAQPNEPITVGVTYTFHTMLGSLIGFDTIPLRASCQMVVFGFDPPGP